MLFEFDPIKSEVNRRKHGIDLQEAQALWKDPHLLVSRRESFFISGAQIWFRLSVPGLSETAGILKYFEDFGREETLKMSRR